MTKTHFELVNMSMQDNGESQTDIIYKDTKIGIDIDLGDEEGTWCIEVINLDKETSLIEKGIKTDNLQEVIEAMVRGIV